MSPTMPRLERAHLTFHLLPLPKGVERTRSAGFIGDEPAATYSKSTNKSFLCVGDRIIPLVPAKPGAPVGPDPLYVGTSWTGKRGAAQGVAWTVRGKESIGCLLPAQGFSSWTAVDADGLKIIGTGERNREDRSLALLWIEGNGPVVLGNPHDPENGTVAYSIGGELQGGSTGPSIKTEACLWRGDSESFVSLHPAGIDASCVRAVSADQQAGEFIRSILTDGHKRAALWHGSADSFLDLTPDGVSSAVVNACAAGFQAGYVEETPRAQRLRAWLWAGSAADSLDLHSVVGGDWDSSIVYRAQVHDGRLLLAGTVERHQQVSGYNNTLMAEQACWWEYPLFP